MAKQPWVRRRPGPAIRSLLGALLGIALMLCGAASVAEDLEVLHRMEQADGTAINGALVPAADGWLYGSATIGGAYSKGTLFRLAPNGGLQVLHDFGKDGDGAWARGMVRGPDGHFYGVTEGGGRFGHGTIYRLGADGSYAMLHSFSADEGRSPWATLLPASDGRLYGVALRGGVADRGTAFRFDPASGRFEVLHSFLGSRDGAVPIGRLVEGRDGLIYGTTEAGGRHDVGTVFKMHRNGSLRVLHSFRRDGSEGLHPAEGLTEGRDGWFYGVVSDSGGHDNNRRGRIYRVDAQGHLEVLYDFPKPRRLNGKTPHRELVLGRDGAFYGATYRGGTDNVGTIFRFDPIDRVLTTLHTFALEEPAGYQMNDTLVEGADGEWLGATARGAGGYGSIFRLSLPPPAARQGPAIRPGARDGRAPQVSLALPMDDVSAESSSSASHCLRRSVSGWSGPIVSTATS